MTTVGRLRVALPQADTATGRLRAALSAAAIGVTALVATALVVTALAACTPGGRTGPAVARSPAVPSQDPGTGAAPKRPDTSRWWGVTLDDVSDPGGIATSLAALPARPVARVVFDHGEGPDAYREALNRLKPVTDLLATPVDSYDTATYTLDRYRQRFADYVAEFRRTVDVWEVGNEVNGEWTGPRDETAAKTAAAFDTVRAAGGRTALTLYYNPDCVTDPADSMLTWARTELADRVKAGVDYVLVSYYEADCKGHRPDAAEWHDVFAALRGVFPTAGLGFGEVGARESLPPGAKADYLRRYYTMPDPVEGFVGGFFWWYYVEDALPPRGNPVWQALHDAVAVRAGAPVVPPTGARARTGLADPGAWVRTTGRLVELRASVGRRDAGRRPLCKTYRLVAILAVHPRRRTPGTGRKDHHGFDGAQPGHPPPGTTQRGARRPDPGRGGPRGHAGRVQRRLPGHSLRGGAHRRPPPGRSRQARALGGRPRRHRLRRDSAA